jgi:nucleoside-diphosphate-sugar epimerase
MRIAVVGGAGYVGLATCKEFVRRGHDVIAITRANGHFLLDRNGVQVVSPDGIPGVGKVDVVLNLAYPNRGPAFEYPERNREILEMVVALAGVNGRVIHTSTQAVFGYDFEEPVVVAGLGVRRDFSYIETKIELENLLLDAFAGRRIDIVRLGNVWGPASPTWTAALADKLAFGDPVGVLGVDGYCNATEVANVADYVAFVAELKSDSRHTFHHLAEFSALRWSWWIERMADRLQVQPALVSERPSYPRTRQQELRATWVRHSPFAVAREWMYGRVTGSFYRSVVRAMPRSLHPLLKNSGKGVATRPLADQGDPTFLTLVSCCTQFVSSVHPDWQPPIDPEASWSRILDWLDEAGY